MAKLDIKELARRGREDPVWWVNEVVGNELWSKQKQIMESVRDNPRTAVRSCNGAGKSFVSANIVAQFLTNHPESIVITTAPTTRQVEEILWQEIARVHSKSRFPLGGRMLKTKWDFEAKWFALGLSTTDPNRFQGFHANDILVVVDEACGVESQIYEGVDSITTNEGAKILLIGNPTEPEGEFYKAFSSPLYNKIHISAFDTPNFTMELGREIPGLTTPRWVAERKMEWGEDSPAYIARVLGDFPDVSMASMIPLSWVMKATLLDVPPKNVPRTLGVDVARYGDDESVIVERDGSKVKGIFRFNKLDTEEVADEVITRFEEFYGCELVTVDAVGVGAGVADKLRHRGYPAISFESAERAYAPTRFNNKRTEIWYGLRERFRKSEIGIPNDDTLTDQLSNPRYSFDAGGRYCLETKDEMKRRGRPSPNIADAVAYAFAYDGKFHSYIMEDQNKKAVEKKDTVNYLLKRLMAEIKEEKNVWY